MDLLIYYITSKIAKINAPVSRLIIGSIVAALSYCIVTLWPPMSFLRNIPGGIIIAATGAAVAFCPLSIKMFIKTLFILHITAFLVGGTAIALYYALGSIKGFSFKFLLVTAILFYILIKAGWGFINSNIVESRKFCKVEIYMNGKKTELTALIDTGHSLYDPITGSPVIVAELMAIKNLFPESIQLIFIDGINGRIEDTVCRLSCSDIGRRIRLIPYKSLGVENGMLIAFRADCADITAGETKKHSESPIIGIYNKRLDENGYNCIIGTDFIK